jgi:hypothetical protein
MDEVNKRLKEFNEAAKYYGDKGEDQLVKDIFKKVLSQKEDGSLTDKQLLQFSKSVAPFLSKEQKEKLDALVSKLLD